MLFSQPNGLAATLLVSLWTIATMTDAAPLPPQALEADLGFQILKQPDTPPKSLPSDPFAHYTIRTTLSPTNFKPDPKGRTFIVGDVHGSLPGLNAFLKKVSFVENQDSLILAGDITAKGPNSLQVIDKAIKLGAKCVRGNHDDKVLRWKGYLNSLKPKQKNMLEMDSLTRPDVNEDSIEYDAEHPEVQPFAQLKSIPSDLVENSEHHKIAKSMTDKQYAFLVKCPLILTLPKGIAKNKFEIHVIHAGIDPKKALTAQQSWVLVNVRNILKGGTPSRKKKEGSGWTDLYNSMKPKPTSMIIYGHDAGRGLQKKDWSTGLDTGCVYAKALSGYTVQTGKVESASCPNVGVDDDDE